MASSSVIVSVKPAILQRDGFIYTRMDDTHEALRWQPIAPASTAQPPAPLEAQTLLIPRLKSHCGSKEPNPALPSGGATSGCCSTIKDAATKKEETSEAITQSHASVSLRSEAKGGCCLSMPDATNEQRSWGSKNYKGEMSAEPKGSTEPNTALSSEAKSGCCSNKSDTVTRKEAGCGRNPTWASAEIQAPCYSESLPSEAKGVCCSIKRDATTEKKAEVSAETKGGCHSAMPDATDTQKPGCCRKKKEETSAEAKGSTEPNYALLSEAKSGCCSTKNDAAAEKDAGCGKIKVEAKGLCGSKALPSEQNGGCCNKEMQPVIAEEAKADFSARPTHSAPLIQVKGSCCSTTKITSACLESASPTNCRSVSPSSEIRISKSSSVVLKIADILVIELSVEGMTCADCATLVETSVLKLGGVSNLSLSVITALLTAELDLSVHPTPDRIIACIQSLGFQCSLNEAKIQEAGKAKKEDAPSVQLYFPLAGNEDLDDVLKALHQLSGVTSVSSTQNSLRVVYNPEIIGARSIRNSIIPFGIDREPSNHSSSPNAHSTSDTWKHRMFIALFFAVPVLLLVFILPNWPSVKQLLTKPAINSCSAVTLVVWALATPIQFYVALPLYDSAYRVARYGKTLNIDSLIVLSTSFAYLYSVSIAIASMAGSNYSSETFFDTSALVVTLITVGRYMESVAKGKAADCLSALMHLQTDLALIASPRLQINDALPNYGVLEFKSMHVSLIERGDIMKILPASRIPTDGTVVSGESEADESTVTGEARPVAKSVGENVIGGTLNLGGLLLAKVERIPGENMLSSILLLVQNAQSSKAAIQRIADRVALYFVPSIVGLTIFVFVLWLSLALRGVLQLDGQSPLSFALRFALATLVISCPCAIGLAVPTAIVAASGVGAKLGVLFKTGPAMEACHKIDTVVFDKTGTLTQGLPNVSAWKVIHAKYSSQEFWKLVGSIEQCSTHAIAKRVAEYASQYANAWYSVDEFHSIAGRGLQCSIAGDEVLVGSQECMQENNVTYFPESSQFQATIDWKIFLDEVHLSCATSSTLMFIAVNKKLIGWVALQDFPKKESARVIRHLQDQGIQVWVLSGDNQAACDTVGIQLGIPHQQIRGQLLPGDKADIVKELQDVGRIVGMVGDGVNDSPALTAATIGFAVSRSSDVAMGAANVVLMQDDLSLVVHAIELSRATNRRILLNFAWAFMYNVIAVPFAAGLFFPGLHLSIPPAFAGLSELLSSLPVVLLSVLLRYFKPSFQASKGKGDDGEEDRYEDDQDETDHLMGCYDDQAAIPLTSR